MGSTNKTLTIELSQYVGTDKPTYLTDYNGDMLKIDNAIATDRDSIATAQSKADGADAKADTNAGAIATLDGQINNASNGLTKRVTDVEGDVNTIESLIGNGTPTTTDKTIIGAINELNAEMPDNASNVAYDNTTSGLAGDDVQEAIDEVVARVGASTFGNIIDIASAMSSADGYTTPSDGYIFVTCQSTSGNYIKYSINDAVNTVVGGSGFYPSDLMPVKKGMVIKTGTTDYTAPVVYGFYPLA